jgi:hypothetical protein
MKYSKRELEMLSLIDGVKDIVELYDPKSPAQEQWKKKWLKKAMALDREYMKFIVVKNHKKYNNSLPICPKCGNNRQVWKNQITGKLTCHRAYCDTEIK